MKELTHAETENIRPQFIRRSQTDQSRHTPSCTITMNIEFIKKRDCEVEMELPLLDTSSFTDPEPGRAHNSPK